MKAIDKRTIELAADAPEIIWMRVQDAHSLLLVDNPKLHDLGLIARSLYRHGMQELPKFDATLNGGNGGIKAGNGRIEALAQLEKQKQKIPRGIGIEKESGAWVMPVIVGVDAETEQLARAYVVDSNNIGLHGGDLTARDAALTYDQMLYVQFLQDLANDGNLPESVDGDDLDLLLELLGDPADEAPDEFPEYDDEILVNYCCPKCGYEWSGKER